MQARSKENLTYPLHMPQAQKVRPRRAGSWSLLLVNDTDVWLPILLRGANLGISPDQRIDRYLILSMNL